MSPGTQSKWRAEETHQHVRTNGCVYKRLTESTVMPSCILLSLSLSLLLFLIVFSPLVFPFLFLGGGIVTWLKHTQLILQTSRHCIWLTYNPRLLPSSRSGQQEAHTHKHTHSHTHTHTHTHARMHISGLGWWRGAKPSGRVGMVLTPLWP